MVELGLSGDRVRVTDTKAPVDREAAACSMASPHNQAAQEKTLSAVSVPIPTSSQQAMQPPAPLQSDPPKRSLYTFGPRIAHGSVAVSDGGRVLTRTRGFSWFLGGWYGGLLEPPVDTAGRSYVEFVIEHVGDQWQTSCRMSMGVTALEKAPDGPSIVSWPCNQSWMYYCNDSTLWPSPGWSISSRRVIFCPKVARFYCLHSPSLFTYLLYLSIPGHFVHVGLSSPVCIFTHASFLFLRLLPVKVM